MISDQAPSSALGQALTAVEVAYTEPQRARRLAGLALGAAGGDPEPTSVAERAMGMARVMLGDLGEALSRFRVAIDVAESASLAVRAAEARGSLAYLLSLVGRPAEALAEVDRATPALDGLPAARLRMVRALVLTEAGRFDEAAAGYEDALAALARSGGDPVLEGDIRTNRSLVHVHRRDWRAAEDDLDRAEAVYVATGHLGRTAMVHHNRALAAAVRGDLPAALSAFDEAAARYQAFDRDPGLLPIERGEALLSVLLVAEARRAAEQAVAQFADQRNAADLVQARLLLARAALLGRDLAVAREQAELARRSATKQQRPGWAALAAYLSLRARWEAGQRTDATIRAGRRSADALATAGWVVEALDARLIVARAAIELGRPATARRALAGVRLAQRHGPAELRARAWHAQALLRLSEGDRAGAQAAVRAGMQVVNRFRASLGATELRVHASGHAGELARLGVQLAMRTGDPVSVLMWTERWRAGTAMLRPVTPANDTGLALDLAELRQVVAALVAVAAEGGDTSVLLKRQAALEEAVRRRARRIGGDRTAAAPIPSIAQVRAALGSAALVEYIAIDGELHAVLITDRLAGLHHLGAVRSVERDLTALRYGLRRLAYELGSEASLAAVGALVEHKARCLDAALLVPLLAHIGDRPLLVVPTGVLHAMPWAATPSCAGRPVSVAPSAALWHRAATSMVDTSGHHVLVSGPGLPAAAAEVKALARRYHPARRFTGRSATVDAVTCALNGAELAHIAAHGHFRADNPLFSALQLVDGPLTVYDLERLSGPPRHVVLSACESGLPAVHPGDELLGLATALLAIGTRTLVATVTPVPDEASRPLMLRLHRHLRHGATPAVALAKAQRELASTSRAARVAATGFLCFGAG